MRPLLLEVEGFTSFKEKVSLDFSDLRVFAITGENGAGKSSLLEAMIFALFGKSPRVDNKKDLVSQGSGEMNVLFRFSLEGDVYQVSRKFRSGGRAGYQTIERQDPETNAWITLGEGESDVDQQIEKILHMPYSAFTQSVIIPQDKFDAFLKPDKPRERVDTITRMFGLEVYEAMRARANELSKEAADEIKILESRLAHEFEDATKEKLNSLKARQKELNALTKSLKQESTRLNKTFEVIQQVVSCKKDLEAQKVKTGRAVADHDASQKELSDLEQDLAGWEKKEQPKLEKLTAEIKGLAEALDQLPRIRTLLERKERTESELAEAEKALKTLALLHETKRKEHESAGKQFEAASAALEKLKFDPKMLEKVRNLAHTASTIQTSEATSAELKEETEQERERQEKLSKEIAHIEKARATREKELGVAESRLQATQKEWHVLELKQSLHDSENCPVCGGTLEAIAHLPPATISRAEKEVKAAFSEKGELADGISELIRQESDGKSQLKSSKNTADGLQKKIATLEKQITTGKQAIKDSIKVPSGKDPCEYVSSEKSRLEGDLRKYELAQQAITAAREESAQRREALQKAEQQVTLKENEIDHLRKSEQQSSSDFSELLAKDTVSSLLRSKSPTSVQVQAALKAAAAQQKELIHQQKAMQQKHSTLREQLAGARSALKAAKTTSEREESAQKSLEKKFAAFAPEQQRFGESDLRKAEKEKDSYNEKRIDAETELETVSAEIEKMSRRIDEGEALRRRHEQRTKDKTLYSTLESYLRANRLQRFVVGKVLESLVGTANEILRDLTQNKYSLKMTEDQELIICDSWSGGEGRSVKTLSGGETFVVSLSLALALSSSVKGGSRLASVFLDEGFGSLDRTRLELVKEALLRLELHDKVVGVVTHLEDFAKAFPAQISIINTPDGARVTRTE